MLKKACTFLLSTSLLTTSFIATHSQQAKADLFCFPWETNCVQDGTVGTSRNYFNVYVENRNYYPIWVAAHFKGLNSYCSPSFCKNIPNWHTAGYWYVTPGQRVLILGGRDNSITNRYIYFHARDEKGKVWGSNTYRWKVRQDKTESKFFQSDMGPNITEFTQTFSP